MYARSPPGRTHGSSRRTEPAVRPSTAGWSPRRACSRCSWWPVSAPLSRSSIACPTAARSAADSDDVTIGVEVDRHQWRIAERHLTGVNTSRHPHTAGGSADLEHHPSQAVPGEIARTVSRVQVRMAHRPTPRPRSPTAHVPRGHEQRVGADRRSSSPPPTPSEQPTRPADPTSREQTPGSRHRGTPSGEASAQSCPPGAPGTRSRSPHHAKP